MLNVLVIDDTEEVRSVVVSTLHQFGFATREAVDGNDGVRSALAQRPDLIICDVCMPGMNGFDTLAAIRDLPAIANIPFIFLTASTQKDDFRRGMGSGADDFLTKPFKPEELLEAVTTRLARQVELKSEIYRHVGKLRDDVAHLLSSEMKGFLSDIMEASADILRASTDAETGSVRSNAREISQSAFRLNELAKSLA